MPAKYSMVPHIDPNAPEIPPKYYPRVKSSGVIDERDLAEEISMMSTLSHADLMAVIEALLYAVPRHLKEGKIVKLGQLGTFYLRVRGQGVDDPADFDVYKVRSSRIHFHPGKILRRMLKTIQYERR